MTKRDRFLAFANFEKPDRPPRRANFTPAMNEALTKALGKDPNDYFDMDKGVGAELRPPDDFVFPDYTLYHPGYEDGKEGFYLDERGVGRLNHGFYHFAEYLSPLRHATTLEQIEAYPVISNAHWLDDEMRRAREQAHDSGDYAQVFAGQMYEYAWQVRGHEAFLMDLLENRDWAELLLDRFCENNRRTAAAAARAGYDCITTGDDVANQRSLMFDIGLWREVMKPRWASVFEAARSLKPDIHIWYHSDGNIMDILDDLVDIGVTILNPVQPECMDPTAIRKRYGKRLAFDGCIGTQTTFPFGTPEEMGRRVHELANALDARHGGLMLSPTHMLEPDVPPENVVAFFEACDAL